jgi:ribosomal-protein-alanine N-acetyltransferase
MTAPPAAAIEVRRLTYADLPQVVAVERRAYPTPWSLAMFVLELSKASGICLAAFVGESPPDATAIDSPLGGEAAAMASPLGRDRQLAGYLVCSRYDTVWHIMNVAVDPDRRRHGIAATLLTRLFERVDDPEAQYTLEVRRSNTGAMALYERFRFRAAGVRRRYYADNGEDAVIMWRTPATLRGSLDDVPNAQPV